MKKAKNAFAIIGIVFAVVAAALLMLHPVIDGVAASITEHAPAAMAFSDYVKLLTDRLPELVKFDWISNFNADTLNVYYPLMAGAVGIVLFIILFIFLLCKKHAKGLGWFFPMLILFAVATVVASVYVIPRSLYEVYLEKAGTSMFVAAITQYLFLGGLVCALVAMGSFVLASIFYIVYACKARKTQKKIAENRDAAIAKIDSILGGAK